MWRSRTGVSGPCGEREPAQDGAAHGRYTAREEAPLNGSFLELELLPGA